MVIQVSIHALIGSPGNTGVVVGIGNAKADASWRSYVKVKWNKGMTGEYRRGHQGALDVKFTADENGELYYVEHLPRLGLSLCRCLCSSTSIILYHCMFNNIYRANVIALDL